MRCIVAVLLALAFVFMSIPAQSKPMMPPYGITFEWDVDTTGTVTGYRLYYGNTSRYELLLQDAINIHILDMCSNDSSCIQTWDDYCIEPMDFRSCDADFYPYESHIDLGLMNAVTLVFGPGTWYFALVAQYEGEAGPFYYSEIPEGTYSEELTRTFTDCPADVDADGDVDGADLAALRNELTFFVQDFGRVDCIGEVP